VGGAKNRKVSTELNTQELE